MNPMKRLGLAMLMIVGVMLLGSTSAWAKPAEAAEPVGICLGPVGDELDASGGATFTVRNVKRTVNTGWPASYVVWSYTGKLTVACEGLTPGATYVTPAGKFTADSMGVGSVTCNVTLSVSIMVVGEWEEWRPAIIDVARLAPDGSSTRVLYGEFWGAY
jgi:hypothetical protein